MDHGCQSNKYLTLVPYPLYFSILLSFNAVFPGGYKKLRHLA